MKMNRDLVRVYFVIILILIALAYLIACQVAESFLALTGTPS